MRGELLIVVDILEVVDRHNPGEQPVAPVELRLLVDVQVSVAAVVVAHPHASYWLLLLLYDPAQFQLNPLVDSMRREQGFGQRS